MATKETARQTRKKLTLKKQTIRDLTAKRDTAGAVRAGAKADSDNNTCLCPPSGFCPIRH